MANKTYTLEPTSGDGNCAFNAFALALSKKALLDQIEANCPNDKTPDKTFDEFILMAAPALNVASTWAAVKNEMIRLGSGTASDRLALQKQLAQPLRNFAIDLLEKNFNEKGCYYEEITMNLVSLFDKQHSKEKVASHESPDQKDDIFVRHQFIIDKFNAFNHVSQLETWWEKEGSSAFLNAMRSSGQFGGEFELVPLAKYVGVTFQVTMERFGEKPVKLHEETNPAAAVITLHNQRNHWSNVIFTEKEEAEKEISTTAKLLKETNELMKKDAQKTPASNWDAIVERAKAESKDGSVKKEITYDFATAFSLMSKKPVNVDDTITVSEKTQIKLDEELARELQRQEYAPLRKR